MASAVSYGTDVFCAIVQRPALEEQWLPRVDDIVAGIDEVCADR
jgi:hypothetical protein